MTITEFEVIDHHFLAFILDGPADGAKLPLLEVWTSSTPLAGPMRKLIEYVTVCFIAWRSPSYATSKL